MSGLSFDTELARVEAAFADSANARFAADLETLRAINRKIDDANVHITSLAMLTGSKA